MDKFKHLHNQMLNCNLNEKLKEKEKIEKEYFLKMNDNRDKINFFNNNNIIINNSILNNDKFYIIKNEKLLNNSSIINSGNCKENIFVNISNKDINKYILYNYNNLSNTYNNVNYNYNCFNINNFNYQINNNNNYIFQKNNESNSTTNNINILNNFLQSDLGLNHINIMQSNLVRNNTQKISLNNFIKYIDNIPMPLVEFICESKGAFNLQKLLEKSDPGVKLYFIQILKRQGLTAIMTSVHGNYFFQKLIKGSNNENIISNILNNILDDFITISKDDSGTFSIQALLNELSSINDINKILQKIKGKELEMIYDKNATYVIQKIVLYIPDFYRKDLNEIILQNFSKLCLDVNGICIIKNFIRTNNIEINKERMKIIITNNFVLLAQSPYGNYSIQFLMEKLRREELNEIFNVLYENIFKLSIHQFSSNVVEKALEKMDDFIMKKTIDKLFFQGKLIALLKNKFGKFVIRKAINYVPNELKKKIEFELVNNLNNGEYNNKDKNRIKKFLIEIQEEGDKMNNNINNINNNFVNHNNINFCMDLHLNCNYKSQF